MPTLPAGMMRTKCITPHRLLPSACSLCALPCISAVSMPLNCHRSLPSIGVKLSLDRFETPTFLHLLVLPHNSSVISPCNVQLRRLHCMSAWVGAAGSQPATVGPVAGQSLMTHTAILTKGTPRSVVVDDTALHPACRACHLRLSERAERLAHRKPTVQMSFLCRQLFSIKRVQA